MVELICRRGLCKYCSNEQCQNEKIIEEFKDITVVTQVVLSSKPNSCNEFDEDTSLIDIYN